MSDDDRFREWGRWIEIIRLDVFRVETTRVVLKDVFREPWLSNSVSGDPDESI
jgi:hypothetical protein